MRCEASGRKAAVFNGAVFRICSKKHVVLFCCSHIVFSSCLLFDPRSYSSTDTARAWKHPVLLYPRDDVQLMDNGH